MSSSASTSENEGGSGEGRHTSPAASIESMPRDAHEAFNTEAPLSTDDSTPSGGSTPHTPSLETPDTQGASNVAIPDSVLISGGLPQGTDDLPDDYTQDMISNVFKLPVTKRNSPTDEMLDPALDPAMLSWANLTDEQLDSLFYFDPTWQIGANIHVSPPNPESAGATALSDDMTGICNPVIPDMLTPQCGTAVLSSEACHPLSDISQSLPHGPRTAEPSAVPTATNDPTDSSGTTCVGAWMAFESSLPPESSAVSAVVLTRCPVDAYSKP